MNFHVEKKKSNIQLIYITYVLQILNQLTGIYINFINKKYQT
jgi:hypothetical protein